MESSIFRFVWRYSRKEQLKLLLMTFAAFPFLYLSLELPKTIINDAINGDLFPIELMGQSFEQIPYLMMLCASFLRIQATMKKPRTLFVRAALPASYRSPLRLARWSTNARDPRIPREYKCQLCRLFPEERRANRPRNSCEHIENSSRLERSRIPLQRVFT